MRITYVTERYPPDGGGVSALAERRVRDLRSRGHQVQLVRPLQSGDLSLDNALEWRTAGGSLPLRPDRRYGLVNTGAWHKRWLRDGGRERPDLVHAATPGLLAWTALRAAREQGIASSADFNASLQACSAAGSRGRLQALLLGALRRLHALAGCTFVPAQAVAAQLQALGFERLQVLGPGVDAKCFAPAWRDSWLRGEWQAQARQPVLLHVGHLGADSNVGWALEAFERLLPQHPGMRLVVVGDGPLRQRLQYAHPRVRFVGAQRGTELARHYASADVCLLPSCSAGSADIALEAMASGLAVVAFEGAAAGPFLRDGHSGWLAPALPGAAGRDAFIAAVQRALASGQVHSPDCPQRQQAVQGVQGCDWNTALHAFEQRLCSLAQPVMAPSTDRALA